MIKTMKGDRKMKNEKLGTEWVGPGKGATVVEITDALRRDYGMSVKGG
jgi:hypothetical protein